MKLRFTLRATQDLAAIADYIVARNPDAALRVRAALDSEPGMRRLGHSVTISRANSCAKAPLTDAQS